MLNTQKALELYILLKDHFPLEKSEFDFLTLIHIIIDSMIDKGQHSNYAKAIGLMHDVTLETMHDADTDEVIKAFLDGLIENDIVELMSFFGEKVKYGIPN